jgi:hypothetical protein
MSVAPTPKHWSALKYRRVSSRARIRTRYWQTAAGAGATAALLCEARCRPELLLTRSYLASLPKPSVMAVWVITSRILALSRL